jgi:hypothetical protein|tara:strand:- start:280 stop:720 length:441 start_codon:yes stop_codon:yes gene_type:complete
MRKALTEKLHYIATIVRAAVVGEPKPASVLVEPEQMLGAFRSVIDAEMHLGLHRGNPGQINRVRKLGGKKEHLVLQWTTPERPISPHSTNGLCDCGCNGRRHGPDRVFLLLVDEVRAAQMAGDAAATTARLHHPDRTAIERPLKDR